MSRELYQARSIKTVKMGRDGLVETDRATGEERRVSQKETETAFGTGRGFGENRESDRDTAGNGVERAAQSDRGHDEHGPVDRGPTVRVTDRVQDRVSAVLGGGRDTVDPAGRMTNHPPAGRGADRVSGKDARSASPEHGPQSRTARKQQQRQKMQEQMAREAQGGAAGGDWIADYLPDFAAPDVGAEDAALPDVSAQDAAAAMRGAVDMPMFAPPSSDADAPKPDGGRAVKRRLKGTEKGGKRLGKDGGERLKPDGKETDNPEGRGRAGLRGPGDVRLAAREQRRPGEGRLKGGDRLRFGEARGREKEKPDPREKLKKRQTKQLAPDAARPEIPEPVTVGPASVGREHSVSKLWFQKDREPVANGEENREQAGETAAADGALAASVLIRAAARFKRPAKKRTADRGRLQFDRETDEKGKDRNSGGTGKQKHRPAPDAAQPEETRQTGGNGGDSSPAPQDAPAPVRRPSDRENGPRLRFGERAGRARTDREGRQPDSGGREKQRQTERFTPDSAKAGAAETEMAPAETVPREDKTSSAGTETPSPVRRPPERDTGQRLRFGARTGRDQTAAPAGTVKKEGTRQAAGTVQREGTRQAAGTVQRQRTRQARQFTPEAAKRETEPPEQSRQRASGETPLAPVPTPALQSAPSAPDFHVPDVHSVSDRSQQSRQRAERGERPRLRFEKEPEPPSQPRQSEQREAKHGAGRYAPDTEKRGDREAGFSGRGIRGPEEQRPIAVTRERNAAAQRDTPEPSKTETAAKAAAAVTERAESTRYSRGRGDAPPAASPATVHGPDAAPVQDSSRSGQRLHFEKETGQTERETGQDSAPDMATRSDVKPESRSGESAHLSAAETSHKADQRHRPERPRQSRENGPKKPDGNETERQPPADRLRQETARLRFEDESREAERDRKEKEKEKEKSAERETEKTTEREAEKDSSSQNMESSGEAETVPSREPPKPADAPASQKRSRLRFEDAPPQTVPALNPPSNAAPVEKNEKPTREQRQYEKAERRVEQASRKLEKAQSKIPVSRRLRLAREYDGASGKYRHRLRFETEPVPEGVPSGGPVKAVVFAAQSAAVLKVHGKLREVERDNVAVEAAHKGEFLAEQGGAAFLRWNHARLREKPYRAVRLAERKLEQEKVNLEWKKFLRDNPDLRRKNIISKWIQKQKIKQKYAAAAHEAKQVEQHTRNIVNATGQIARAAAQFIAAKKSLLATVALLGLIVLLFSTGLVSCTAMLSGFQSSYISVSYMADEEDITQADLYYTEMETALQIDIDETQTNHPGYDEYRYNVGEIAHNPFELLSYLSTKYNAFKFNDIKSDIEALFWQQYTLTRTVVRETRSNGDGSTYTWYVLVTTLSVRPLSSIASATLDAGEEMTRYSLYMQTCGDRQAFGNPFDFPWLARVSSLYGYRKHPMTGAKNLHRGVDIGAPEGTEIKAIQDGRVVTAEELDSYGLCVVIEDENRYSSRYAHCSRLDVHAGQRVKRGDVIAAVGSTGDSTGPHLHLETKLNGEYLNPLFFVETGGTGGGAVPGGGGVVIPAYPGEAPTDETFARMLAEAERYLGYPYVWGGSSPATSFDCSGYVSWVINHSGWNVGRLGAQALCNLCTPVSPGDARPGDLVFFRYTYNAPIRDGVTHVGIYVGNDTMIHCGSPISYANLNTSYWQSHFYLFGRLPSPTY